MFFVKNISLHKQLSSLNLAGCCFSTNSCRAVANYMIYHTSILRDLNLAYCKISNQGSRYIVNALNRNNSIRYFNFSHNELHSSKFEFAIKMGAILTRHPNLMHVDLSSTGLNREEVLFVGLAITMSKTMLSLHLSQNTLPYYDRIFLRTLIAAKVQYKTDGHASKSIKNNKEYTQVLHLANKNNYSIKCRDYIAQYNSLDLEREGLDFDIRELMDEIGEE